MRLIHRASGRRAPSTTSCWWLNWNASQELRDFVVAHAADDPNGLACGLSSEWWAKVLIGADYAVVLIDGEYREEGHTWLEVDGVIFDPTAAQYDDFPEMDEFEYVEHARQTWRPKWR